MVGVRRDIEELGIQVDDLDKAKDRRAGEEQVQLVNSRLSLVTQRYREAVLTSRRLMESSSRFSARDELLQRASKPKSALEGQVADSPDDALMTATSDVTEGLRRTMQLMQQELDRSLVSNEILESSTATMQMTSDQYSTFSTLLTTSKALITSLERADFLDRLILLFAVIFFGLCCAWVFKRRVVDKGIRVAGALGRVVSAGKGKVPPGEIVKQELKRSVADLSETLAAITTTATAVAATLSEITSTATRRRGRMREIKPPPQPTKVVREPLAAVVQTQHIVDVEETTPSASEIVPPSTAAEIIPTPPEETNSHSIPELLEKTKEISSEASDVSPTVPSTGPSPIPFPEEEPPPSTDFTIADNSLTPSIPIPTESITIEAEIEEICIPTYSESDLYPTDVDSPTDSQSVTPLPEISAEPTTEAFDNMVDGSTTLALADDSPEAPPPTIPEELDPDSPSLPSPAILVPSAAAEAFATPIATSDEDVEVVSDDPAEPEPAEPDFIQPFSLAEPTATEIQPEPRESTLEDAQDVELEHASESLEATVMFSDEHPTLVAVQLEEPELPEVVEEILLNTSEGSPLNSGKEMENEHSEEDQFEEIEFTPLEGSTSDHDVFVNETSPNSRPSGAEIRKEEQDANEASPEILLESGSLLEVVEEVISEQYLGEKFPTSGVDEDIDIVLIDTLEESSSVGSAPSVEQVDSERHVDEKYLLEEDLDDEEEDEEDEEEEEAEGIRWRDEL